ncbi:MAG: pilus assembly protein PilP [Rickettsiella sp.]|nr:pilus assembly protein PilP [Rickettsiella sp.]
MSEILKKLSHFFYKLKFSQKILSIIFSTVVSFLIFILGYFFYSRSYLLDKKLVKVQICDLHTQLLARQKNLTSNTINQEKLALLEHQFFFNSPKNTSIPQTILSIISGLMLPQYLIVKHLKFLSINHRGVLTEFRIKVLLQGEEKNVKAYFYQIANLQYPIFLEKFKWVFLYPGINISQSKSKLSLLFIIFAKKDFFSSRCLVPLSRELIFNSESLHPTQNHLTRYSFTKMKLVGFLVQNKIRKKWALIKLPDDQLYKVELNNRIGMEKAKIIFIGSKKIILKNKVTDKNTELILNKNS